MDKFEQFLQELKEMSDNDRNNTIKKYKESCICETCPTYNECAGKANEKLFCITGKSIDCIKKIKGCECPPCPFAHSLDIGMTHNTYCFMGSENEQRG